jgi:peptidoglycan/LPS O-acetylase OafA/YrhL
MFKLDFDRSRPERLDALQALRAVGALLVVFSHVLRLEHEQWLSRTDMFRGAMPFGEYGVDAFFVVSGFIMYFTAGRQFGQPGAPGRFLHKRLIRIAPIYWLFTGLILFCPFAFGARHVTTAGLALSLAFLPDMTNAPWFVPALAVGWSLSFEMLFYLAFAACLCLPKRAGLTVLLAIFPAFLAGMAALDHTQAVHQAWWPFASWWARQELLLFALGVVLAMAQERFGRLVDRRGLGVWIGLGMLIAAPAGALVFHFPARAKVEMGLAAGAVLLCAMTSGRMGNGFKPLTLLGDASYALYLSHTIVIGALSGLWCSTVGPRFPLLFDLVALAGACIVAVIVHAMVEKPMVRAGQRFLPAWA